MNFMAIILIGTSLQSSKNSHKADTVETGGAGGSVKTLDYILPIIELKIGEKKMELKDVAIHTVPTFKGQRYNGNIGQDVIRQFDRNGS